MGTVIRYADQNITEIDAEDVPEILPVIPMRNSVVLPGVLLPIFVGRQESIHLVESIGHPGALVCLFTQVNPDEEKVSDSSFYQVGTLCEIHRMIPMSEGGYQIFLQGVQKVRLLQIKSTTPHLTAEIEPLGELKNVSDDDYIQFRYKVLRYVDLHPGIPSEIAAIIKRIKNPSALANQVIFLSKLENEEKVHLLSMDSVEDKVTHIMAMLEEEIRRLRMENEVREKVENNTTEMQREFYLRKQLDIIRKELGETEDDDVHELEKNLRAKFLPDDMRVVVDREFRRYRRSMDLPHGGGLESGQIRNWLDLVMDLPFEEPPQTPIRLDHSIRILEEDHEGLGKVKDKIIDFLAVEKQTGGSRAPILCLVGPPGVGKTSLARSVARAMSRPFVRASLGGIRDEAEIRGHRRTYVGALPGKILNALKKVDSRNPVFLLDEIDKMSQSFQGDPSAAMLEVLDPEQNNTFEDHYLAHPFDLSRVLFIATANNTDSIPSPLLDRMEVITISGYTLHEKRLIAQRHLLPGILRQMKLNQNQISMNDGVLDDVISHYTREAGVRSLKRVLETIVRKAIRQMIVEEESQSPDGKSVNKRKKKKRVSIRQKQLVELLGKPIYEPDVKENTGIPGVAVGLAWTPVGGQILYVEATSYMGKGKLHLSGQLGDVMKESAHAALSFIKSHALDLDIDPEIFRARDIHIHIPGGAIPKDGPSAGVTLMTALVSLFSKKCVAHDIAMTGEISLRGKILPVGGIKEKVLAAMAAGIDRVFLPEQNRSDFEQIASHVTKGIQVFYFSSMMDLLPMAIPEIAFDSGDQYQRKKRTKD